jgi:hypothetical protein
MDRKKLGLIIVLILGAMGVLIGSHFPRDTNLFALSLPSILHSTLGYCCEEQGEQCKQTAVPLKTCLSHHGVFSEIDSSLTDTSKRNALDQCNNLCGVTTENTCCLCQYMEDDTYDECSQLPEKNCKDQDDMSCTWVKSEQKCKSRFIERCKDWLNASAQDDCTTKMMEDEEVSPDEEPIKSFLATCTDLRWYRRGHSDEEQCGPFAQRIKVCMKCVGQFCNTLDMKNAGCDTFKNVAKATQYMQEVRTHLRPGQHLTVSGNQTIADTEHKCLTYANYDMTVESFKQTYDPCLELNAYCYADDPPESAYCTDKSGKVVQQTCCYMPENEDKGHGTWELPGGWVRGTKCPHEIPEPEDPLDAL